MNKAKRKTDIVVGVISKKRDGFARLIADSIQMIFRYSHYSVHTIASAEPENFDEVAQVSSIVIIDKSLGHDLHGTDGMELLGLLAEKWPHKKFMAMSSYYDEQELAKLTAARFKLRKPVHLNIWKKTIEHCIGEIELQREIDANLWKTIEES